METIRQQAAEKQEHADRNLLDFSLTLSEPLADSALFAALYTDGKLTKLIPVDSGGETEVTGLLEHTITPDNVKFFIWKSNLIPVCKPALPLCESADYEYANAKIVNQLQLAMNEINDTTKVQWLRAVEQPIIDIINSIADDALSKKSEQLLTREFVRRYYNEQLNDIKTLYDALDKREKSDFQNKMLSLESESISDLIDYLGLKELL